MATQRRMRWFLTILGAAVLAGCATTAPAPPPPPVPQGPPPLRVGVNSGSAPYVFWQNNQLVGMEIDFAKSLAARQGRPLKVVDMPFDKLIPALGAGHIDIIMSGMTITRARELRVAFSAPYLRSGLIALISRVDVERYPTGASVLECDARMSVVQGTTGEKFVREKCPYGMIYPTENLTVALSEIRQHRSDILVNDAPVVAWAVSGNEADFALIRQRLDAEDLGWGVSRENPALLAQVNDALAAMRSDGTRDAILDQWVPYWRELEQSPPVTR